MKKFCLPTSKAALALFAVASLLAFFSRNSLSAQSAPCVTEFGDGGEFCNNSSDTILSPGPFFVRIFIHVIRDSSGQGGQTPEQVEEALGYLDKAFNPHDIYFVRDCDIIYHNEQICYEALSISTAGVGTGNCLMPPLPNLPNGVNVYLLPDHYTDTYAGAAIAFRVPSHALAIIGLIDTTIGNLSQVRSYTFAHEMGHCLGLYHTHFGTGESGGGAGTCLGLEECADGTNCGSAGDYICDTPAEPILFDIVTQNFLVLQPANGQKTT